MKKLRLLTLTLVLTLTLFTVACARLSTGEDSWLCTDQGWVKHGSPSAPMPSEPCEGPIEAPTGTPIGPPDETPIGPSNGSSIGDLVNIKVDSPAPNDIVESPFTLKGSARVFENQFNWKLKNKDGTVLAEASGYANAPDMGQFGPFEVEVEYDLAEDSSGVLEVFDYSAKDGSIQDLVSVPLNLRAAARPETEARTPGEGEIAIKLFFTNDKLDPEVTCEKVFPAERIVPKSKTMARVAMEELLKGPTESERAQGFGTTINAGVKINRLVIVDGVVHVDFDRQMEYQVGGSCRVGLIGRQIIETLRQFPTVKEVLISIEGRTEDILQP